MRKDVDVRRRLGVWISFAMLFFGALVACSSTDKTDETQVSQLLRADRTERFFYSAPQQCFEMSWSTFSRVGFYDDSEIAYPIISAVYPRGCTEVAQIINDTIKVFLETFLHEYGEIQILYYGNLVPTVMRFDEEWFSIKYQGEVFNPARANDYAFAFNFDMRTGELLILDDLFDREAVLSALGNGDFSRVYGTVTEWHEPLHLEDGFRYRRFLYMDKNRNHNFFFDDDSLYLIISTVSSRHYVIYGITVLS